VETVRLSPVPSFLTVTFTLGTAAPDESDTNPTMEPTSFCAHAGTEKKVETEISSAAQNQETPAIARLLLGGTNADADKPRPLERGRIPFADMILAS
jgi:hypothetical protein